jgi:hypothetical protein
MISGSVFFTEFHSQGFWGALLWAFLVPVIIVGGFFALIFGLVGFGKLFKWISKWGKPPENKP